MHRNEGPTYSKVDFDSLDDAGYSKSVDAQVKTMMDESMAEARELLSDDPDELAYVEMNYHQLARGLAFRQAAQEAFENGDFETAAELDRQKDIELADMLARAGKRGGLFARIFTWLLRRRLK